MRVAQLITYGPAYLEYYCERHSAPAGARYAEQMSALLADRYGNSHILQPVLDDAEHARYIVADATFAQRAWAREKGMPANTKPQSIVLAQIEEHRSEVLYNITPILYGPAFLKRLPSCVRTSVCWRAAPLNGAELDAFDLRLSNFPPALEEWRRKGQRAAFFEPSHDPVASEYATNASRSIDIAFVGSYGRHHVTRNRLLQRVAELVRERRVQFHFAMSRSTRYVNALPFIPRLFPYLALPDALRRVSRREVYGRAMYELFGRAKIVVNAAIDMASQFRGNMRCWEAMGCGAVMLSDDGVYPSGMRPGLDFVTYRDADDALDRIDAILADYDAWRPMAERAVATMESCYSKKRQWESFCQIIEAP